MRMEWLQSDMIGDSTHVLIWAEGGDFEAFEDAMDEDPTVSLGQTFDAGERRLYRFRLVDEGARNDLYPRLVSGGGVIRRLTASHEGWKFGVVWPDYDAARGLFDFILDRSIDLNVRWMVKDSVLGAERTGDTTPTPEARH